MTIDLRRPLLPDLHLLPSFIRGAAVALVLAASLASPAFAVPSFARQTGLSCNACHTTPPELNSAGRRFKLLGFTDRADSTAAVQNPPGTRHVGLDLLQALPLSAMVETSLTTTSARQPGTQNGTFQLPQDVSVFLAGGWSTHIGSFLQMTYDPQSDHFSMDNTDIRYANKGTYGGKEVIYGLTLNNNPTVEDIWNSTPAWGYPFVGSASALSPGAAPFLFGGLAEDVAGVGGYGMWNDNLYGALTLYRSNHIGAAQPNNGDGFGVNISGVAPYWRVAWQKAIGSGNNLEIGAYGMRLKSTPGAVDGPKDNLTDTAFDFQYDRTMFIRDVLSVRGTYIRESQTLDATFNGGGADQSSHNLRAATANVEYHFGNAYSAALGWINVTGTSDESLYAPADLAGFANGSPDSSAYIANVSWWPVQNLQLAAQYTGYTKFNGAKTNYDGSGRNAKDNNSLYLLARFLF